MTNWIELRVRLEDADPEVRCAAAVAIGELWKSDQAALPTTTELLAELARCDANNPGVADAFFATVAYEFGQRELVKAWTLQVLAARQDSAQALSPVPGNDLEFHAHEWFDSDFAALESLLSWEYVQLVIMALDHGELPREQNIALIEKLCSEYGQSDLALPLATRYGVLRPEFLAKCGEAEVDGAPAHLVTQTYGAREQWTVQWLFFHTTPFRIPRAREDGAAILSRLRAWALLPGDIEAKLDRTEIRHVAFPEIPGTTRRSFAPRPDIQLDVAVRTKTSEIVALRIVRARRGLASIHEIGAKKAK